MSTRVLVHAVCCVSSTSEHRPIDLSCFLGVFNVFNGRAFRKIYLIRKRDTINHALSFFLQCNAEDRVESVEILVALCSLDYLLFTFILCGEL